MVPVGKSQRAVLLQVQHFGQVFAFGIHGGAAYGVKSNRQIFGLFF